MEKEIPGRAHPPSSLNIDSCPGGVERRDSSEGEREGRSQVMGAPKGGTVSREILSVL